jgi:hypothetical protein
MENDLEKRISAQDAKLDAILRSVEQTRRYFKWTLIVTVIVIVLPLVGLVFVIPQFIETLTAYKGLGF